MTWRWRHCWQRSIREPCSFLPDRKLAPQSMTCRRVPRVGYAFHNYLPDRGLALRTVAAMKATDQTITTMLNANGDGAER